MGTSEDQFWIRLLKKAGRYISASEQTEEILESGELQSLTRKQAEAIVRVMPIDKRAEASDILNTELSTEDTQEQDDLLKHIENQSLFTKFKQILNEIGSPQIAIARQAIERFLTFWTSHQDAFCSFLYGLMLTPSSPFDKQILGAAINPLRSSARVVAHYNYTDEVSPAEARGLIEHPSTIISTLVPTERKIFVALVSPKKVIPHKDFAGAFWLWLCEDCHVFVVSRSLAEKRERPFAIWHELSEFKNSLVNERREETHMTSRTDEIEVVSVPTHEQAHIQDIKKDPFAVEQIRLDEKEKQLVALWVTMHMCLRNGAGILIDAGSACFKMWKEIIKGIQSGLLRFLVVYTNSFLVLEHWGQQLTSPGVRQTYLELTGTRLDWEHLAFYGPEAIRKVMNPGFRATNVYIGTSGIEFDEKTGSIDFGYMGPAAEPEYKELLFKCRASARIILATARKIGFAGGRAFNVLDTKDLNVDAPIFLVTTNPEKGSEYEKQFNQALDAFQSEAVERAICEKGLEFHWITINRKSKDDVPEMLYEIVVPKKTKEGHGKYGARDRSVGKSTG